MANSVYKYFLSLVITRIIELAVLYFTGAWIWARGGEFRVLLLIAFVALYVAYVAVTLRNDIHEFKYGEGEPMM